MENKIKFGGIIANCFLLIAFSMSLFDIPNQILLIIAGILIMSLFVLPLFLIFSNRQNSANKKVNWGFTLCSFLLIPILFFLQEGKHLQFKTAIILLFIIGAYVSWYIIDMYRQKKSTWNKISFFHYWLMFITLFFLCLPVEFQLADKSYNPTIETPAYSKGEGPLIYFDGGHNNFHTLDSRLYATGNLLEKDGYQVQSFNETVSLKKLEECKIFLISNALNDKNKENWANPIYPAFSNNEVSEIKKWVYEGGALFLIADHTPFPRAIYNLASQFGFEFMAGYTSNAAGNENYFYRGSKSLVINSITNGRYKSENVDSIFKFTGCAIKIPSDATPILMFDSTLTLYKPNDVGDFEEITLSPRDEYSQGAYKTYGKGRVVVFGEAMMFTAQLGGGLSWIKIGMNSTACSDNYQLCLNTIHWLDGLLTNN